MNMKVRKSVIAFLMATTMVGSTAVPAMAATANVTVSIKATGLTGDNAKDAENYIVATKTLITEYRKSLFIPLVFGNPVRYRYVSSPL